MLKFSWAKCQFMNKALWASFKFFFSFSFVVGLVYIMVNLLKLIILVECKWPIRLIIVIFSNWLYHGQFQLWSPLTILSYCCNDNIFFTCFIYIFSVFAIYRQVWWVRTISKEKNNLIFNCFHCCRNHMKQNSIKRGWRLQTLYWRSFQNMEVWSFI